MTWTLTILISIAGFKIASKGSEENALISAFAASCALTFLSIITGEMPYMAYILIFASYFSLLLPSFFYFNESNSVLIPNIAASFTVILLLLGGPINIIYAIVYTGQTNASF